MVRDTSRQRIAHCNDSDVRMEDLLLPLHGRSEWELDEAGTQREPRRRGVTGSGLLLRGAIGPLDTLAAEWRVGVSLEDLLLPLHGRLDLPWKAPGVEHGPLTSRVA